MTTKDYMDSKTQAENTEIYSLVATLWDLFFIRMTATCNLCIVMFITSCYVCNFVL